MAKDKEPKPEADKTFQVVVDVKVGRKDIDKDYTLITFSYPNCTRLDLVAIQHVLVRTQEMLCQLGYASVKERSPDEASAAEAMDVLINAL